ncbi:MULTISPECIES: M20/M25/M40 family metallo-hydrolase [Lysinibacillus]|uniref:M20/M25/M40 family metallo-hydrolase n=1 Tax=Lysinibacillus antri TaxID=2498145 RepID=A0A432LAJ4_9BACI|nr:MULTISPECIES: M20/M25/M40 family metallo-hydrolase [Lysinibacillus]RUL51090.1 M20/M25/M40 family metallo-hydrolase [Lysinibacillus antri]TSI03192.1 M20/M25/M40 family metallo-hydrolase [Lysinibacillus sp. BW-2-10]
MKWDTPEKLKTLLYELVSWESQTLTKGEQEFSKKLIAKLQLLPYFNKNRDYLQTVAVEGEREVVSALYKHPKAKKTVVLISHFDTVQIEEYGALMPLATLPEELTQAFHEAKGMLNEQAQQDLQTGDYLFGRGVMDMKMGLALHMQVLERAIEEAWSMNLLLVTVPDEEVSSAGMLVAVKHITEVVQNYDLELCLFLNSEPSFSQGPYDTQEYIYSGSIGKVMPAALFYGKETHVGEPLKGISAPFMSAYLEIEMEWNDAFCETVYGETTPLPVALKLQDLKTQYSTQTPYRAVAMYNVFLMKRSASEIFDMFEEVTKNAMVKCQARYDEVCAKMNVNPIGQIRTIRYSELLDYATNKLGKPFVEELIQEVLAVPNLDERDQSFTIADKLLIQCQELAPAVVILFVPPYYPAVNSSDHPLVKKAIDLVLNASKPYEIPLQQVHYFNGICDLSYCQLMDDKGWQAYEGNTPVWNRTYNIPFEHIAKFSAPVLNVGPYGKDAHQISERLHVKSAFYEMPDLIYQLLRFIDKETSANS